MTGNVALDVVIGLVFVYLLYSLYASILMELISSLFGLRAKNLRYTLKRMLADEKHHQRGLNWLAKIGMTIARSAGFAPNLINMGLYEKFMEQPNIRYLGSGGFGGRPSYITAENFSKALIETVKIDAPELNLMAAVEIGVNSNLAETSETRKHLESLMKEANYDPVKFKILVETWFNDTMDRSTGWFKQTTQTIVLIIGLVLTISFNIDSFAIIKKLSRDKDVRDQMVKLATEFNGKNQQDNVKDSNSNAGVQGENNRTEELKKLKASLEEEISNSQTLLQSSWFLPDSLTYHVVKVDSSKKDTVAADHIHKDSIKLMLFNDQGFVMIHKMVDGNRIRKQLNRRKIKCKDLSDGQKIRVQTFWYKLGYVFFSGHFWGYFLTILALSLGAPFWFDLLNKLVKLRTGKQVDENSGTSAVNKKLANKETLNRVG